MTALILELAGPLQSWGTSSRFQKRETDQRPSKSGVIGLVAAALGRGRDHDISDLAALRFAVRADQPGSLLRDFHTATLRSETTKQAIKNGTSTKLSDRFYLQDAVFIVALEGNDALMNDVVDAFADPGYAPFLGRRSCPPSRPLVRGLRTGTFDEAIAAEPWAAAHHIRHGRRHDNVIELTIWRDTIDPSEAGESVRDLPISFDSERRLYAPRTVVETTTTVTNPLARGGSAHDPFELWN